MGEVLKIHRHEAKSSSEVFSRVLTKQYVAKILKPSTFEHGFQSSTLVRYSYNAGEMILPRRDTEQWLHWTADTAVLMIELPPTWQSQM